ncbi:MAG: carbohydrate kinase family protein [Oscillospiraceae bacterium]|nr:carbohydrate kinase family protein [Oscillospiraceae bacterium]
MKYVVAGSAAADCITFADGTCTGFVPGGATLFALTGIQLWTDDVLMCGGFGADYMDQMGQWMERNQIDRRAFNVRDPRNPLNYMFYRDEGGWDTKTVYGVEHYDSLDCNPRLDHLEDYLEGTVGLTIFRGRNPDFFQQIFALRRRFGVKLNWEIKADYAVPEYLPELREMLQQVDSFSINQPETFTLFGVDNDEDAIRCLRTLASPLIIYRVGKRGIYIIKEQEVLFAPSYKKYPVVDVTGCGNSSTAAAFYAWCEEKDIYEIAAYANVTAAQNLRYYGAMELSAENKALARQEVAELTEELRRTQTVRTIA